MFGFMFWVRWTCVSSWVFVSGMGFGVWFQRLGKWIWVWWVSAFGCGCGFVCGVLWVCFMVAVGLLVMLCWCLGGGRATFFFFNFICDW